MNNQWIQTVSGKRFYPLNPRPQDVDISDIAHALSMKCRFSGHCLWLYSVGEHSINVADILPKKLAIHGLLHDAAEAYLLDVARPIKSEIFVRHYVEPLAYEYEKFTDTESRVMEAIYRGLGIQEPTDEEIIAVKHADLKMLSTERRDVMAPTNEKWIDMPEPSEWRILVRSDGCLGWEQIKATFLERFEALIKVAKKSEVDSGS